MYNLLKAVEQYGVNRIRALLPLRPVRSVFGMIAYTTSSDPEVYVLCEITEERYKLADNYKVGFRPLPDYQPNGREHARRDYYISDFNAMLRDGGALLLIQPEQKV
jgi:hypothetical protein